MYCEVVKRRVGIGDIVKKLLDSIRRQTLRFITYIKSHFSKNFLQVSEDACYGVLHKHAELLLEVDDILKVDDIADEIISNSKYFGTQHGVLVDRAQTLTKARIDFEHEYDIAKLNYSQKIRSRKEIDHEKFLALIAKLESRRKVISKKFDDSMAYIRNADHYQRHRLVEDRIRYCTRTAYNWIRYASAIVTTAQLFQTEDGISDFKRFPGINIIGDRKAMLSIMNRDVEGTRKNICEILDSCAKYLPVNRILTPGSVLDYAESKMPDIYEEHDGDDYVSGTPAIVEVPRHIEKLKVNFSKDRIAQIRKIVIFLKWPQKRNK